MVESQPLVVERRVAASPDAVFAYLTDSERWAQWQGVDATIDARPGGEYMMRSPNLMVARGRVVEVVDGAKLAFSWGWEGHPAVPPGSTLVVIELLPDGDGTVIRLTHSGLPEDEVDIHRQGWDHYTDRLALLADGGDPGPDPGVA